MASLRKLPSGRWQASVLLDDGTRTTKTFDTPAKATEWAEAAEDDRDRLREERRSASRAEHVDMLLAALQRAADDGDLTQSQRDKLGKIIGIGPAKASA